MAGKNYERVELEIPYEEYYTKNAADHEPFEEAMARCKRLNDEVSAATVVRKHRDKLLQATDYKMTIDRIGLTAPSYDLAGLVKFIKTMVAALNGSWAQYRQALRDIPEQEGFPFNVKFPEPPKEE